MVFSTKDRQPVIAASWRDRLHAYIGGVAKNIDGVPESVGGAHDQVHLLLSLKPTHCLANMVRDLKAVSSRWMHEEIGEPGVWQDGYGAFSLALRTAKRFAITSRARRSITEGKAFRRNISSFYAVARWNTTSVIYGKDSDAPAGAWPPRGGTTPG